MIDSIVLDYDALGKYTLLTSLLLICAIVPLLLIALALVHRWLRSIPRLVLVSLILVLVVAAYLRIFLYPHLFTLYLDDYYPLEIANKIVHLDFSSLNSVFVANALIFVPAFALFGVGFKSGMYVAIALSIASLILFFTLAYLLTKDYLAALIATALMSLQPSHIQYSFSTYNHIPTFFGLMLALSAFFSYFETRKKSLLYLSLLCILFLLEMRTEILLLVPILLMYFIIKEKNNLRKAFTWVPWAVFGLGIAALIPKFFFFNLNHLNYTLMSISNFLRNLGVANELLGVSFIGLPFLVVGLVAAIYKKNFGLLALSCIATGFLALVLSMEFSQIQGARHLHFTIAVMYLLFGSGICFLLGLIRNKHAKVASVGIVVLAIVIQGLMHNVSLVNAQKTSLPFNLIYFDTRLPEYAAAIIPLHCTIVSPHPAKYSALTDLKAIPVEQFLFDPNGYMGKGCIVFAEDLSCSYPLHEVEGKCDSIRKLKLEFLGMIDTSVIEIPYKDYGTNASFYYIKN